MIEMKFILNHLDHQYMGQSSFMQLEPEHEKGVPNSDGGSGLIQKMRRMSHKYEKRLKRRQKGILFVIHESWSSWWMGMESLLLPKSFSPFFLPVDHM